ncbi:MAG: hypothetical protein PHI23_01890, partial [Candidatus Peribacteraceae bacterium]|nr:hypothetical protein [Candidatus Peribacteraceae bacterium]
MIHTSSHCRHRPAASLVELVLFLAFFAAAGSIVLSILFATSEQRVAQRAISAVERNGLKALQSLSRRTHHAERILAPALGSSGTILALQISQESENPSIVALLSGALVLVRRDTLEAL